MPYPRSSRARLASLAAVILAALAAATAPAAVAGTYTISGTCGLWDPYNNNPSAVAVYASCPTLVARNVYGPFTSPAGADGGWVLNAPAGAGVSSVMTAGNAIGKNGWQATLYAASGNVFMNCPGPSCPGAIAAWGGIGGQTYGSAVIARLRCGSADGCTNNAGWFGGGNMNIERSTVTIADWTAPSVAIAGGSAVAGGWRAGTEALRRRPVTTSGSSGRTWSLMASRGQALLSMDATTG